MTKLYLIRHGETDFNIEKRFQGQSDVPLNAAGHAQAAVVAEALATMHFDRIYSSDLVRAMETARAIAGYHSLPVTPDPRWRECSTGEWTGMTVDEVNQRWPGVLEDWWRNGFVESTPAGGESLADLTARAREAMLAMGEAHPGEQIAIATHGGTIRAAIAVALDVPPTIFTRVGVDNCSVTTIEVYPDHGLYLRGTNDISHFTRRATSATCRVESVTPAHP